MSKICSVCLRITWDTEGHVHKSSAAIAKSSESENPERTGEKIKAMCTGISRIQDTHICEGSNSGFFCLCGGKVEQMKTAVISNSKMKMAARHKCQPWPIGNSSTTDCSRALLWI
ncbi:hypothetical protein LDENG_00277920 [Lucifuga dentata]|nr:hypothetical protein LDENG_00277920 [Lucifuga dentata]